MGQQAARARKQSTICGDFLLNSRDRHMWSVFLELTEAPLLT